MIRICSGRLDGMTAAGARRALASPYGCVFDIERGHYICRHTERRCRPIVHGLTLRKTSGPRGRIAYGWCECCDTGREVDHNALLHRG
jgi:hypothetical protein